MVVSRFSVPFKPVTFEKSGQVKLPRSRFRCGAGPSHCDLRYPDEAGDSGSFLVDFLTFMRFFMDYSPDFRIYSPDFRNYME